MNPTGNGGQCNLKLLLNSFSDLNGNSHIYYPSSVTYIEGNIFNNCGCLDIGTRNNVYVQYNDFINIKDKVIINWATYNCQCYFRYNNIYPSENNKNIVGLETGGYSNASMIATNNYWNTMDANKVSNYIIDENTDYSCAGTVEFLPISNTPFNKTTSVSPETEVSTTSPITEPYTEPCESTTIQLTDVPETTTAAPEATKVEPVEETTVTPTIDEVTTETPEATTVGPIEETTLEPTIAEVSTENPEETTVEPIEETTEAVESTTTESVEETTIKPTIVEETTEVTTITPTTVNENETTTLYYLPNAQQAMAGYNYKIALQDKNGKITIYNMEATGELVDGIRLYSAEIPVDEDISAIHYQVFDNETWLSQVSASPLDALENIITSDGKVYHEDSEQTTASGYVEPTTQDLTTVPNETATDIVQPTTEYVEPTTQYDEPTEPTTDTSVKPTPNATKKGNSIKISVKTKTVKLKKLKKKAQKVKAITVKKAQGKVTYKLVKKGSMAKIFKLAKINSKGVITLSKWKKAKKGTYKLKVTITAAGNSNYNKKTVNKVVKIKIR